MSEQTALQEKLPLWDLRDLYQSPQDPAIESDKKACREQVKQFVVSYKNQIETASGSTLLRAIEDYEKINERLGKLYSYAALRHKTNLEDAETSRFYQSINEVAAELSAQLVFFTLDIIRMHDDILEDAYKGAPAIKRYQPWFQAVRLFKDHVLSEDVERFDAEKSVTSAQAWVRYYDERLSRLTFNLDGKTVTLAPVLDQMSSHPNPQKREEAAQALASGLKTDLHSFLFIFNILLKDKNISDTLRHYPHPVASRNLSNQVEDEVVEALVTAVTQAYPQISHRYYAWKAKRLGVPQLKYWDRNAPLTSKEETRLSWEDAKDTVLHAYETFSPEMAGIAKRFFASGWIDAAPRSGKESGAFSHGTVPSVHPYILLNYFGKPRDVMTLAHELGHGIHQTLSNRQGVLMSDTGLNVAETASVFGEMLTFRALLTKTQSKAEKEALLAGVIEDRINTVIRQIAFHQFELFSHLARQKGELTLDELSQIWFKTQKEALGPSVDVPSLTSCYWAYISHFFHVPFYVHAYAFADCVVTSLYALWQSGHPRFQEKYLDLLQAGGTKTYAELVEPFGLNPRDPGFWAEGMSVISGLIDELEALG